MPKATPLPTTVTIGPFSIRVCKGTYALDWAGAVGLCVPPQATAGVLPSIVLHDHSSAVLLLETFMHELIHQVASVYGFELNEHSVKLLGAGLAQALSWAFPNGVTTKGLPEV